MQLLVFTFFRILTSSLTKPQVPFACFIFLPNHVINMIYLIIVSLLKYKLYQARAQLEKSPLGNKDPAQPKINK